jgi:hypothetical protein
MAMEECDKIKAYFTKEEIDDLNEDDFDPELITRCIYGLMTGSCNSDRVTEFIEKNIDKVILTGGGQVFRSYNYVTPLEEIIFCETREFGLQYLNYIKS